MTGLYNIFERHPTVTIDSRNVPPDSMFFAIKGDNFDGNDFAADALAKGAAYAVVDRPESAVSERYILVDNVLSALQHLATYHRRVLGIPILAITGSNGKTTTKELTARVLSRRFLVAVTKGNLNNHIGVPLTLLSFKRDTEFGVVEMGASARGEIEQLCNIAQPDFGIITNVGKAHLEGFGSLEGVMLGKGEMLDYLWTHHGLAFYMNESIKLSSMVESREGLLAKAYSEQLANGVKNKLTGDYNRYNIAAAIAIGEYFGITPKEIQEAIESYTPDNMRSQRIDTKTNTLILDCYNANPTSMRAALKDFARKNSSRPKAVILGDMLELGEYANDEHALIIRFLQRLKLKAYLVGKHFSDAARNSGFQTFTDSESLSLYLAEYPLKHHLVLLKGSNSMGLDKLKNFL